MWSIQCTKITFGNIRDQKHNSIIKAESGSRLSTWRLTIILYANTIQTFSTVLHVIWKEKLAHATLQNLTVETQIYTMMILKDVI